ncbi:hypothetical protein [Nonomuraea sp. NPDC050310]|uniref:hypothetical protein n=1 Tax=Nonomuraea sp. NPDC050310 TaxID=3154935 RepID=UPI003406D18E
MIVRAKEGQMTPNRKLLIFGFVLTLFVYAVPLYAGWWFLLRHDVEYVDTDILPELRAVGRVVHEYSVEAHEWENDYVEIVTLVVHIDKAGEDVAKEAVSRLGRSGWSVWEWSGQEIDLRSSKWPRAIVTVDGPGSSEYTDRDLQEAASTAGLPIEELAAITIQE